jgi:hypothetical protein
MADQAGTPTPEPGVSAAQNPEPVKDDSALNDQQKKEWMTLKQKAEQFNKLEAELAAERAKTEQLARMAYGGQQATDPRIQRIAQLQEQAQYDPVAAEVLDTKREVLQIGAEKWLSDQMLENEVPKSKRESVAALIRANGYQMSVSDALNRVTDPDTKTLADQLSELRQENERLKNAKPNGVSPASVTPANVSADEGNDTTPIKLSDYTAALTKARSSSATDADRERAAALMKAVGGGKKQLERD